MPQITIDGKVCEFEGKKNILQVALDNDIEIPHYCYHPGLSVVASCRICLAEVEQPNPRNDNKLELIPKLLPTCQTPAVDGSVVHTQSPKSIANQKSVMEYLLINHPLDCPVCDQAGECYLQDYSYDYGRAGSRYLEEKIKQPKKDVGQYVMLYSDRCIMCTRCVRFTHEVTGTHELGVFGRGSHEQIDVFPGMPVNNELSGNVVDICPVGALLDKDFLFTQRVWLLKEMPTIDGITASGDNIWVHQNEGRVYRIKPRTNVDVNKWWISDEIRYGWKFVHDETRLSSPRRMSSGEQIDSDWAKAYQAAAAGLRDAVKAKGEGSLVLMVSPMLTCEEAYLLGSLALGLDAKATLAVGPVPRQGDDKTFPGGYTVHAEKCPNSRGVRRVLEQLSPDSPVLSYEAALEKLGEKASTTQAAIITGNFPSNWLTKDLTTALRRKFVVLIDTLATSLSDTADVVLPGATWVEKAGTFESATHRLQCFDPCIPVLDGARPEAQIALDLSHALGQITPTRYDAPAVRQQLGGNFVDQVHEPARHDVAHSEMQLVEL